MAALVDRNTLRTWHEAIMATAKDNYDNNGWDIFVECIDVNDFVEDYNRNLFVDFISALEYYKDVCRFHNERRRDIEATVF